MKTINASTPISYYAGALTDYRRHYGNFDSTSVKRAERRKSRRVLNRQVAQDTYPGVEKDFGKPIVQATAAKPLVVKGTVIDFPIHAVHRQVTLRTVTVVRKLSRSRRVVETLQVPQL